MDDAPMTNTDSEIEAMARAIANWQDDANWDRMGDLPPISSEMSQDHYRFIATAALTAYRKWLDENGYVIAPKEPTEEMLKLSSEAIWDFSPDYATLKDDPNGEIEGSAPNVAKAVYGAAISTLQKDESK